MVRCEAHRVRGNQAGRTGPIGKGAGIGQVSPRFPREVVPKAIPTNAAANLANKFNVLFGMSGAQKRHVTADIALCIICALFIGI